MIRISGIEQVPLHEVAYEFPAPGGQVEAARFPIFRASATALPNGIRALVAMSDLQGRVRALRHPGEESRLLGEVVVEELVVLSELGEIAPADRIGVILCGDLFVLPDLGRRGGKGDVRPVWERCHGSFRWVTGIAGNHDRFGGNRDEFEHFLAGAGVHYLDAQVVELDGIRIGGVSGIIGRPSKPFRRSEEDFLAAVEAVLAKRPDILVLHQGPSGSTPDRRGSEAIRELLERADPTLTMCGHTHWESHELETLRNGSQILNTDSRGYLIVAERLGGGAEPGMAKP